MAGSIGKRIRRARREAGFANAESFAVTIGVGVRTVQRWESGSTDPSIAKLAAIARTTGKPLSFFVNDELELEAAAAGV